MIGVQYCLCASNNKRSPGKVKSPSTLNRDMQRHQDLWDRSTPLAMEEFCQAEPLEKSYMRSDNDLRLVDNDNTALTEDGDAVDQLNKATSCDQIDKIDVQVNTDYGIGVSIGTDLDGFESKMSIMDTSAQVTNDSFNETGVTIKDEVILTKQQAQSEKGSIHSGMKLSDKQIYVQNMKDKSRNLSFSKMVHDTRNEHSNVYGITDDMIFSVDERKRTNLYWAVHDAKRNKECKEIKELIERWPAANATKCEYGVRCLNKILPDVMKQNRADYFGTSN